MNISLAHFETPPRYRRLVSGAAARLLAVIFAVIVAIVAIAIVSGIQNHNNYGYTKLHCPGMKKPLIQKLPTGTKVLVTHPGTPRPASTIVVERGKTITIPCG